MFNILFYIFSPSTSGFGRRWADWWETVGVGREGGKKEEYEDTDSDFIFWTRSKHINNPEFRGFVRRNRTVFALW